MDPSRWKITSAPFAQSMSLKPVVDNWISDDNCFHQGAPDGTGRLFSPMCVQFVDTFMSEPGVASIEIA